LKLLFDANLSPKLVGRLAELFPDSAHVSDLSLGQLTPDETIWKFAGSHGFTIVTADSDFLRIAEERGAPPNVVRLENCNYKTPRVEETAPAQCCANRGIGAFLASSPDHPKHCLIDLPNIYRGAP
jgi:predicted nuclease of predicted toxin-antitoxin system